MPRSITALFCCSVRKGFHFGGGIRNQTNWNSPALVVTWCVPNPHFALLPSPLASTTGLLRGNAHGGMTCRSSRVMGEHSREPGCRPSRRISFGFAGIMAMTRREHGCCWCVSCILSTGKVKMKQMGRLYVTFHA